MSQNTLLSSRYRDFSVAMTYKMTDQEIHTWFCKLRWGSETQQACPRCGLWESHYLRALRQQWRCKGCGRDFSVTTETIFASRKKSLRSILLAVFFYVTAAKGLAAASLCRLNDYSFKAAYITTGKLRESLHRTHDVRRLNGIVQMDGGYFGGKPRKPNRRGKLSRRHIADKVANKKPKHPQPWIAAGTTKLNWQKRRNRRVVMVMREIGEPGKGATRTITAIARSENQSDVKELVHRYIESDSIIMTDENNAYSMLSASHEHYVVSHQAEYVTTEGVNSNQAEAFYGRMRRGEYGVFHGFRPIYLADYANEMAWREDMRHRPIREHVEILLSKALSAGHSRWWRGYYQGKRRGFEILMDQDVGLPRLDAGGIDQ